MFPRLKLNLAARVLICAALVLAVVSPSIAQDTVLVTYQGFLTDGSGAPITGSPSMRFAIYDALGVSKWAETYLMVPVSNGAFSVLLGSRIALPSSVFDGSELYLGVRVGADAEMTPRTLLTSTPGAAFARSLVGDIKTEPGRLLVKDEGGSSAIVLAADPTNHTIQLHPPDPCVPPDPCIPAVELIATSEVHGFKIHPPDPCTPPDPCAPAVSIEAGDQVVDFDVYITPPDDDAVEAIKLGTSLVNGSTHMNLVAPDGNAAFNVSLLEAGGFATSWLTCPGCEVMGVGPSPFRDAYSLLMYDPSSADATEPKFELFCGGGQGAGFDIFDDAGKVMGVEPTPFNNGYAIKLLDPALPDAPPIVEISSRYSDGAYGKVNIGYRPPPDDGKPGVQLTSDPSAGKIIVGGGEPAVGGPPRMIMLEATADVAQVGIGTDTPSEALHVVGNIYATGTITELSDVNAKTDIEPIEDALALVEGLQGVRYSLKAKVASSQNATRERQIGLVAQDVEKIVPEVVRTPEEGYKSLDYSRLTALLVEAVKELKTENDELRRRVEALEGK